MASDQWRVARNGLRTAGGEQIVRWRNLFSAMGFLLALGAAGLWPAAARADYAVLRSGARLHITGYERDGERVRLTVDGGTVNVAAAEKHGVDEGLITWVIAVGSNFNPRAVSRKRAQGLMQLLPATAAVYAVSDIFDPAQNIDAGTRYLKDLLARYRGDLRLALAAYNAGPEMVERYGGVPPFAETQKYVRVITGHMAAREQSLVAKN